ncbi:MAG: DnaB-like helicase C-terminal domain-containing protein [Bacteroidota bacterium]
MKPLTAAERFASSVGAEMASGAPPSAPDAESAVLGAILSEPSRWMDAVGQVQASDFYEPQRAAIFAAMATLAASGRPIDIISVQAQLDADAADVAGWTLTDLAAGIATTRNVGFHARIVAEKAMLRRTREAALRIAGRASDPHADALATLDGLRDAHDEIAGHLPSQGTVTLGEALKRADERTDETGAPCRLSALAYQIGGWRPGKLYVGAGRPGRGKSSHAKTEALHVARMPVEQGGGAVMVFTLEMGADEYAARLRDEHQGFGWPEELDTLPIHFDDSARLTTTDVRAKLHSLTRQAGPPLRLVVVDYLQLLTGRGQNREQEVASIARDLKTLAREFEVAVFALAQINRSVETRSSSRPTLADLRESGEIEQSADVVMFYTRPELDGYDRIKGEDDQMTDSAGMAEVIVAKQRGGPVGDFWCRFDGPTTSFRGLEDGAPRFVPALADTPF